MLTLLEVFATLFLMRFFFRFGRWLFNLQAPGEHPAERAARLVGFEVPAGYNPRPQWWQRGWGETRRSRTDASRIRTRRGRRRRSPRARD